MQQVRLVAAWVPMKLGGSQDLRSGQVPAQRTGDPIGGLPRIAACRDRLPGGGSQVLSKLIDTIDVPEDAPQPVGTPHARVASD